MALIACCTTALFSSASVIAASDFVVRDIKITGLQRVSTGTVLNYLPVQVGEDIGPESTPKIIRALYETGFFQSVVLEREGNTIIVQVVERATIGSVNVVGNDDIPSDKIKEILKDLDLVGCLRCACIAQFGRAVSRQQNEGDMAMIGFHDGG